MMGVRPTVLVGCPVRDRAWVLPQWFEYAHRELEAADVDWSWCFAVPDDDEGTVDELVAGADRHGGKLHLVVRDEPPLPEVEPGLLRSWTNDRFEQMTAARNALLAEVRGSEPDFFWSIDSDILAAPGSLRRCLERIADREFGAAATKVFMCATGTHWPNFGWLPAHHGFVRRNETGCFPVDVIMGYKVMTPAAYSVDYRFDRNGEDIGWSKNCRDAGVKLGWDGDPTLVSKHVFTRSQLDKIDKRCGY